VTKGLTLEFLGQLSVLLLVVIVHKVFNLIFKSGDLGGEPVCENLQVFDCLTQYINFNLAVSQAAFSSSRLAFKSAKVLAVESRSPGMMARAIS
jgi:hypothetical protein